MVCPCMTRLDSQQYGTISYWSNADESSGGTCKCSLEGARNSSANRERSVGLKVTATDSFLHSEMTVLTKLGVQRKGMLHHVR